MSGAGAGLDYVAISLLWLKAFGVTAIEAGGTKTREYYHSFAMGDRFKGVLHEVWREGDDAIYGVPLRSSSLAHVMRRDDLVTRAPINGIDLEQIRAYVAALDSPALPEARFTWLTQHSAAIDATMRTSQVISVQVTYDPGWRAGVNGRPAILFSDGLGLLVVEPHCEGKCQIQLSFDGGREMLVARWFRGLTILCWIFWYLWVNVRRSRFPL